MAEKRDGVKIKTILQMRRMCVCCGRSKERKRQTTLETPTRIYEFSKCAPNACVVAAIIKQAGA